MMHIYIHADRARIIKAEQCNSHVSIVIAPDYVTVEGEKIPIDPSVSIIVDNLKDLDRLEQAIIDARNKLLTLQEDKENKEG